MASDFFVIERLSFPVGIVIPSAQAKSLIWTRKGFETSTNIFKQTLYEPIYDFVKRIPTGDYILMNNSELAFCFVVGDVIKLCKTKISISL